MKKLIFVFILFRGLAGLSLCHATAECNIVWSGYFYQSPVSGSSPTAETARTQQATYEVFINMYAKEPQEWSNGCYNRHDIWEEWPCDDYYYHACQDGRWSYGQTYCAHHGSGYWDVVCESTLIELSSFIATPKSGKIILSWNTASETDNVGFNLYRAESENGEYIQINDSLIPAKGTSTAGATYEFIDSGLKNRKTYYYKLEDIDVNGVSTFHGPVTATPRLLFRFFK